MRTLSLAEASRVLPDNTLLLHIGAQKTGTTALQSQLADSKRLLTTHGWTYLTTPGEINANKAVREIVRIPYINRVKSKNEWHTLQELYRRADTKNVVISSEFLSSANTEDLQPVISTLSGRTVYALLTVRDLHSALPSQWQEQMQRWQEKRTLNKYILDALSGENRHEASPHNFWLLHDYSRIISNWEELLGPEKVIVICLKKHQPDFLFDSIQALLRLRAPLRKTTNGTEPAQSINRSLSAEEAQTIFAAYDYLEQHYPAFFTDKRRLLNWSEYKSRTPFPRAGRVLTVSPEASEALLPISLEIIEEIESSTAQVIGSVASLSAQHYKIDKVLRDTDSSSLEISTTVAGALIATARMQGLQVRATLNQIPIRRHSAMSAKRWPLAFARRVRSLIHKSSKL